MVKIYSVEWCGPCNKVKRYLDSKGIQYDIITVADSKEDRDEVFKISGQRSVPVTIIDDKVILGFDKAQIDVAISEMSI